MTTYEMECALAVRYPSPEFAFMLQVRNSTGYQRAIRTCDALALGLWPSRGQELHGFEIKASRSDWMNEKKNPEKAHEIQRFCHRWWLVIGDKEIVKPGELPPNWGLLAPRGSKLQALVDAPTLSPEPITYEFLAGILRNVDERMKLMIPRADIQKELTNQRLESAKAYEDSMQRADKRHNSEIAELKASIESFEKHSGIRIDRWNAGQIGSQFSAFMQSGPAWQKMIKESLYNMEQVCFATRRLLVEAERDDGIDFHI